MLAAALDWYRCAEASDREEVAGECTPVAVLALLDVAAGVLVLLAVEVGERSFVVAALLDTAEVLPVLVWLGFGSKVVSLAETAVAEADLVTVLVLYGL